MKKKLIFIGASGHGKVLADIAIRVGYEYIAFLDDRLTGKCLDFDIIGTSRDIGRFNAEDTEFFIAIGNNQIRRRIAESNNVHWATLIHPSAQIAYWSKVGVGTAIMAGAIVNAGATIGDFCIINTGAIVEHDNVISDYVHISPNVALAGTVHVGAETHIGVGATVKNNINICENSVIGAGAVVIKDIIEPGTYIGVPTRKM